LLLFRRVVGQAEAEPLVLGALVGEKAVERVKEHTRNQLPHEQRSLVSGRLGTCILEAERYAEIADLVQGRTISSLDG
jgi:hypothetical protein